MLTRREFIKNTAALATATAVSLPFVKIRAPLKIHDMLAGGVLRIYTGSMPKIAGDKHEGKLLCTIGAGEIGHDGIR